MSIALEDLVGLNRTTVHDLPIVDGPETAERLLAQANKDRPLALAGTRHSQGGHTMVDKGRVLLTAAMNHNITVSDDLQTVTVDAGVTWAELHRVLAPLQRSPKVHQSSPHFTVGGSISVNCHGRDPRSGPISTTLRGMTVLCGDGEVRPARPGDDLFRAVVGGYGSCGLILNATLDIVDDVVLEQVGTSSRLDRLAKGLCELARGEGELAGAHLLYGWLCCVPGSTPGMWFYDHALTVEYRPPQKLGAPVSRALNEHAWGMSELMRAAWSSARSDLATRRRVWGDLVTEFAPTIRPLCGGPRTRTNWMRASVDFANQWDADRSDILLEYFLPASDDAQLALQIRALGDIFTKHHANILSTTLRLVQPDTAAPYLSYCAGRPMVCMAIDVDIGVTTDAETRRRSPDGTARAWIGDATRYVLEQCQGSYYLPYFGFADLPTFRAAYSRHGADWQAQQAAIQRYNKGGRLRNRFMEQYFPQPEP